MKDVATYRFTISFQGTSEANVRVGELLKTLGHKKSEVIVAALNAYLDQNPELLFAGAPNAGKEVLSVSVLEKMIENIIIKKLETYAVASGDDKKKNGDNDKLSAQPSIPEVVDEIKTEVSAGAAELLGNLGAFFE